MISSGCYGVGCTGNPRVGSGTTPDAPRSRCRDPKNVYVTLASLDVLLVLSIAVATVLASSSTKRLASAPTPPRLRLRALAGSIGLSFAGAFVMLRTLTDAGLLLTRDRAVGWDLPLTAAVSMVPVATAVLVSRPRLRALADGANDDLTDPALVVPVRVAAVASVLGVWFWFVVPAPPYWDDAALAVGALAAATVLFGTSQRHIRNRVQQRERYRSTVSAHVD
jgi:hypothetical protein